MNLPLLDEELEVRWVQYAYQALRDEYTISQVYSVLLEEMVELVMDLVGHPPLLAVEVLQGRRYDYSTFQKLVHMVSDLLRKEIRGAWAEAQIAYVFDGGSAGERYEQFLSNVSDLFHVYLGLQPIQAIYALVVAGYDYLTFKKHIDDGCDSDLSQQEFAVA